MTRPILDINRRSLLRAGGSLIGLAALPPLAWADEPEMRAAIKDMFGERTIQDGRVILNIPPLSENGYSVSLDVEAESPMTPEDYVKQITIFSERNPIPLIAVFHFTPQSGRAYVGGNIRLGGTQSVHAIAEMNDGSLWSTSAKTFVTLAACVVL